MDGQSSIHIINDGFQNGGYSGLLKSQNHGD